MKCRAFLLAMIMTVPALVLIEPTHAQVPTAYSSPNDGSVLNLSDIAAISPFTVTSDGVNHTIRARITIEALDTLVIGAGEKVVFNPYMPEWTEPQIVIKGKLFVNGTYSSPVIFTTESATPTPSKWLGLRLIGGYSASHNESRIANATIEYAGDNETYGLFLERSSATIDNCTFRQCGSTSKPAAGILALDSNSRITNCAFYDDYPSMINASQSNGLTLDNCTFSNAGASALVLSNSNVSMNECTFVNCSTAFSCSSSVINASRITANANIGAFLSSSELVMMDSTLTTSARSLDMDLSSSALFIDSNFDRWTIMQHDEASYVEISWRTTFRTVNPLGMPIDNATTKITNATGVPQCATSSDANGQLCLLVTECVIMNGAHFVYTPYHVECWKIVGMDNLTGSADVAADHPQEVNITMRAAEPNITLENCAITPYVSQGGYATFAIYYNNTGSAPTGDVYINDTLSDGLEYVSNTLGIEPMIDGTGILTWQLANVPVGEHCFEVTARANTTGILTSNVTLDYFTPLGKAMPSSYSSACVEVIIPTVVLEPSTTEGYATYAEGVHVRVFVNNTSPVTIYNATLSLVLPANCTLMTKQTWPTLTMTDDFGPGRRGCIWYVRTPYTEDGATLRFVYNFTWSGGSVETYLDIPVHAPRVTVSDEVGPRFIKRNATAQIMVTYSNVGNETANETMLFVSIPPQLTYVSDNCSVTPTVIPGMLSYNLGLVPIGEHYFIINVSVPPTAQLGLGYVNSTVHYKYYSHTYPTFTTYHSFWIVSDEAVGHLELDIATENNFTSAGEIVELAIFLNCTGELPVTNISINITLPSTLEYVTDNMHGNYHNGYWTEYLITQYPSIYNFSIFTRVNTTATDGPIYVNGTVEYLDEASAPQSSFDSLTISVVPRSFLEPNIAIELSINRTLLQPNETFEAVVYYNNTGLCDSPYAWLNVSVPAGVVLEYSSISATTNTCGNVTYYEYEFANLSPGAHHITLVLRAILADNATVSLSANINYTNASASFVSTASADVQVSNAAHLQYSMYLDQQVDAVSALPGAYVNYTIRYANNGTSTIESATMTAAMSLNVDFLSSSMEPLKTGEATYVWTFANVTPGEYTLYIRVHVKTTARDGTMIYNNITLEYSTDEGNDTVNSTICFAVHVPPSPMFTIDISEEPEIVSSGTRFVATIDFDNVGTLPAEVAWINITVGNSMTFVSSETVPYSGTSWRFANVSVGEHSLVVNMRMKANLRSNVYSSNVSLEYVEAGVLIRKTGTISVTIPSGSSTGDGGTTIDCMTCFLIAGAMGVIFVGIAIALGLMIMKGRKEKREPEYSGPIYANAPKQEAVNQEPQKVEPPK